MGLYAVLRPCVVGNLHYAQVPAAPIDADDKIAAPLVTAGALAPVVEEKPHVKPEVQPHRRRPDKEG